MTTDLSLAAFSLRPIGEIAASLPGATSVFRKRGLDFCCGGEVSLADAARDRDISLDEVETDLRALQGDERFAAAPAETPALIDYILERYHETHRRELPELVRLARTVEKVHADHPYVPRGLADLLEQMIGELEVHMKKEELILFPAMRRQSAARFDAPITQMRHDHDEHGAHLRQIETLTGDFQLPDGACRTWAALYTGVEKLVDDLMEHVHLENNVLFPRFESRM